MKIKIIIKITTIIVLTFSCTSPEEWNNKYDSSIVPEPVSNVQVKNVNGGAIITYTLPTLPSGGKDPKLLGAKIVYALTPDGEVMERWASAETNSIELEGFGDTNERKVTVYAVHKNGNVSAGVSTTIEPLTPPIFLIRETLRVSADFGGVRVTWDNPLRKSMGVTLYVEDTVNEEMVLYDKYFSDGIQGKFTFRRFDPEERKFRIEMFDRWQNYAQPLEASITPFEEVDIVGKDKSGNQIWFLFDDGRVDASDASSPMRWTYRCDNHTDPLLSPNNPFDRVLDWDATGSWNAGSLHTLADYIPGATGILPLPTYHTFDMGKKATYSRMAYRARPRDPMYSNDMPVEFDVWGTNNAKKVEDVEDPNGIYPKGSREANQAYWTSWKVVNGTDAWKNDWVKIGTCKIILSSGDNQYYVDMPLSAEDIDRINNGFYFDFDLGVTDAFRYIRWEMKKFNTEGSRRGFFSGIKYWGSYAKD